MCIRDRYDTDDLSLKVLTGWEQVKDNGVWDCVIELSTAQAIYLNEQGSSEQLRGAIRPSDNDTILAEQSKVDDKRRTEPELEKNSVVIYSSVESQLGELWKLMCQPLTILRDKHHSLLLLNIACCQYK